MNNRCSLGLTVLAFSLLAGLGSAALTDTQEIEAGLAPQYTIDSAPGDITGWNLTLGNNIVNPSAGSVRSNVPWKVQVNEAGGDGKMESYNVPGHKLQSSVVAKCSPANATVTVTMSGVPQTLWTGVAGSIWPPVRYEQNIVASDKPHDDYWIQLTYTISAAA